MEDVIYLAGGGTGGHLFPGLAVAESFKRLRPGLRVEFIGTRDGMDAEVIGPTGYPLHLLAAGRGSPLAWRRPLNAPKFAWSLAQCAKLFRGTRPLAVVGLGGFAAGAPGLVARWTRTPLFLIEPNARPGRVNRWLSGWARGLFLQFDEARSFFAKSSARMTLTGAPLRSEFAVLAQRSPCCAGAWVVVVGGSQGGRRLNELFVGGADKLLAAGAKIAHVTGKAHAEAVRSAYRERGLGDAVEVIDFSLDMAGLLSRAGLVVARAGTGGLSEFAASGTPVALLPLSTSMDDHQRANARAFAANGGAKVFDERQITGPELGEALAELWRDAEGRRRMGTAMRAHARPRASDDIARSVLAALEESGTS